MNSKVAKELRRVIREEMPQMIETEYSKANHTKMAADMRTIISEIVPKMLEQAVVKSIYERISAEVKERMDALEKYVKETNEHRAVKLEEALKTMMESQVSKAE